MLNDLFSKKIHFISFQICEWTVNGGIPLNIGIQSTAKCGTDIVTGRPQLIYQSMYVIPICKNYVFVLLAVVALITIITETIIPFHCT